jgi:hypothetical protein
MSHARHNMKPKGKSDDYSGSGKPKVIAEAMEKKHGGKVGKHVEKEKGEKPKARMDKKPRRASGGRVGSDKSPFSSAASPKQNTEA